MSIKNVSKSFLLILLFASFGVNAAVKNESSFFMETSFTDQGQNLLNYSTQPEFAENDYYSDSELAPQNSIQRSILGESADEVVLHVIDAVKNANMVEMNDVSALKQDPRLQQMIDSPEFQALMQRFK
ncbi:MAG: hypothetical protein OEZ43_10720 [Gammaproteobacteria bacterium]|nr:hypothetical protein [Gammaproteobacteria bacterium]